MIRSKIRTTIFIILRRAPDSWSVTMAGLSDRRFVTFTCLTCESMMGKRHQQVRYTNNYPVHKKLKQRLVYN